MKPPIFLLNKNFNNFIKLYKKKFYEIVYIITNLEKIIKEKEKEILAKRKEILARLRDNWPDFKQEFISALCLGLVIGVTCIILTGYYGDHIDKKEIVEILAAQDLEKYRVLKWYKPLQYNFFPHKLYVGKAQIVIAWIFNDIIDVYNCPIDGLAPGISPDLYFNP